MRLPAVAEIDGYISWGLLLENESGGDSPEAVVELHFARSRIVPGNGIDAPYGINAHPLRRQEYDFFVWRRPRFLDQSFELRSMYAKANAQGKFARQQGEEADRQTGCDKPAPPAGGLPPPVQAENNEPSARARCGSAIIPYSCSRKVAYPFVARMVTPQVYIGSK